MVKREQMEASIAINQSYNLLRITTLHVIQIKPSRLLSATISHSCCLMSAGEMTFILHRAVSWDHNTSRTPQCPALPDQAATPEPQEPAQRDGGAVSPAAVDRQHRAHLALHAPQVSGHVLHRHVHHTGTLFPEVGISVLPPSDFTCCT